ncbi:uncharacterized protein LAESUDRAFT_712490 [Laetiporus sulphureus 93-53]|uniref:Uncharacterized protein n=1 Tax=Laetiporus sulphureus 93-53 TaxID=1314785 RepID=A0A165FER7_9APHY|nr:uncharacterized protein LAESUDRAFT_712490 [Laetiporus sulphureus 93-53]KZT08859.1 hypothetical protein LAESUDRAFT_712490 [Laetiporus sulphureus 93-53]
MTDVADVQRKSMLLVIPLDDVGMLVITRSATNVAKSFDSRVTIDARGATSRHSILAESVREGLNSRVMDARGATSPGGLVVADKGQYGESACKWGLATCVRGATLQDNVLMVEVRRLAIWT